jgi:hypothetical protein
MSFSFDASTDLTGSGSYQGQLSSSYTNALSSYLQTDGADYVAFLAYVANELSVEAALELKAEIEAGNFTLSGLFSAAQSKTGEVDGDFITDPEPTLTVTVGGVTYTIDLTAMLTGTDTASWDTVTKKDTITHTREFFAESTEPADYDANWAAENSPPVATEIVASVVEYDEKAMANAEPVYQTIDLLSTASDPDSDTLSVVADSVMLANGDPLPSYITVDGNSLTIDTNSAEFDTLYKDATLNLDITYKITDGIHTIDNTVDLTITGTADQFTATYTNSHTPTGVVGNNATTWDGAYSFNIIGPDEGFDFNYTGTATVTVTGDIDNNHQQDPRDEKVVVTVEGQSLTFGMLESDDVNQEPGETGYEPSTQTQSVGYVSSDSTISVAYDSTTSNGANGVDQINSIEVEVTYTYWA